MDNNKAMEILIKHNQWRRGDMDITPHNAIQLGQAIDCAIQALGDGWVDSKDRLPRLDEASKEGKVLAWSIFSGGHVLQDWRFINSAQYTFWQIISPPKPKQT